jgi:hypothetical protein
MPKPDYFFRKWEYEGIECGLAMGFMGVNGYVRLPPGHPDLPVAEAYNIIDKENRKNSEWEWARKWAEDSEKRGWSTGHDALDYDVHEGLTYGPDEDGWIGFDTGHAFDYWSDEEIEKVPIDAPNMAQHRQMREVMKKTGFPFGERNIALPNIHWTVEKVAAEVEKLAAQVNVRATIDREA